MADDATSTKSPATNTEPPKALVDPWADFWKNLPTPETKPISGATTMAAGAGYPGELVAYSLLDDVTSVIATQARRAKVEHVLVIEDRALLDSEQSHMTLTAQLDQLHEWLDKASGVVDAYKPHEDTTTGGQDFVGLTTAAALLPVISAVPKLVGGFADVVGMLRTNYALASRTMSPTGTPLLAEVARTLNNIDVRVSLDGFSTVNSSSPLLTRFKELLTKRQEVSDASAELRTRAKVSSEALTDLRADRQATLTSLLKALESDKSAEQLQSRLQELGNSITNPREVTGRYAVALEFVDGVLAQIDGFTKAALTPTASGGRSPLLAALAREALHGSDGPSHILFVSLDSAGADTASPASQTRNTEYVRYIGGMQVSYFLYSVHDRVLVASGVERRIKQVTHSLKDGQTRVDSVDELT